MTIQGLAYVAFVSLESDRTTPLEVANLTRNRLRKKPPLVKPPLFLVGVARTHAVHVSQPPVEPVADLGEKSGYPQ